MKRTTILAAVWAIACLAVAAPVLAQSKPIFQSTDRATGAVIKVFRTLDGPRLEVQADTMTMTKVLGPGAVVVTTLSDGKESLRIESGQEQMTVRSPHGNVSAPAGDRAAADRARELVAKSPLTKRAATLIGKLGFGDSSPITPVLLTTRAFLLAATRDGAGFTELKNWMNRTRSRSSVTSVALPMGAQKSSSQCYKEYGDELLATYDEFVECIKSVKWYDPFFPRERCEFMYEVRILAAFAGWMSCLGVLGE